eukprot:12847925-Alexandrium_andersonii.AAC.1
MPAGVVRYQAALPGCRRVCLSTRAGATWRSTTGRHADLAPERLATLRREGQAGAARRAHA